MIKDLRHWLDALEANALLTRHKQKIDVRNCPQIIFDNFRTATLFEDIQDYSMPVVANAFSSRQMMALALETTEDKILSEYQARILKPIPPVFSNSNGRCQEVVNTKADEVDLTKLPILLQHEFDGGPYITASVVLAKDPETTEFNIGIYRLMFRSKDELGINITAPHKLRWFYQKALQKSKPLEVAVCIGLHTLDYLAAVTTSPEGTDELALWGGLQKEGIRMVKCKTIDLHVPEHAEFVLEARIDPMGWVEPEGMYGEFPGTYSGMRRNPFLKIQAITSRKDPIYQSATHGGKHLAWTDFFVLIPQIELSISQALKSTGVDVRQVRILEESAGMICYVSIQARSIGDSKNALYAVLTGSRQNFPKYCVVVDSDIDVFDDEAIAWAISTRTQPREASTVLEGLRIPSSSDPSLATGVRTMSKLGIDATIPFDADRSRFLYSKPPRFQIDLLREKRITREKSVEERIRNLLSEGGPKFFYEIASIFQDESFRDILLSWSRLKETGEIGQGMDGKYVLRERS